MVELPVMMNVYVSIQPMNTVFEGMSSSWLDFIGI